MDETDRIRLEEFRSLSRTLLLQFFHRRPHDFVAVSDQLFVIGSLDPAGIQADSKDHVFRALVIGDLAIGVHQNLSDFGGQAFGSAQPHEGANINVIAHLHQGGAV